MEVALSDNRLSQPELGPPHDLPTGVSLVDNRRVLIYEEDWEDDTEYVEAVDRLIEAARAFLSGQGSLDGLRAAMDKLDLAELG